MGAEGSGRSELLFRLRALLGSEANPSLSRIKTTPKRDRKLCGETDDGGERLPAGLFFCLEERTRETTSSKKCA